jgi:hypothetical protein
VPGTVVRHVVPTALRAAWQRDGGDGAARDETAWTRWTLPPAISGCFAYRYRGYPSVSSCYRWTGKNAAVRARRWRCAGFLERHLTLARLLDQAGTGSGPRWKALGCNGPR